MGILGLSESELEKRKQILVGSLAEVLDDYIQEVEEVQEKLSHEIQKLLQTSGRLCKELSIELPQYGKDNLGLYAEKELLKKKVAE